METYEILDVLISGVGVIVTITLNIFIWHQTKKLNIKQQELDIKMNESQIRMQEKQIQLDLYNHRREILYFIIEFSDFCIRIKSVSEDEKGTVEFKINYLKMQGDEYLAIKRKKIMVETDSKNLFDEKTINYLNRFVTDVDLILSALVFIDADICYSEANKSMTDYLQDEIKYAGEIAKNILDYKDVLIETLRREIDLDKNLGSD